MIIARLLGIHHGNPTSLPHDGWYNGGTSSIASSFSTCRTLDGFLDEESARDTEASGEGFMTLKLGRSKGVIGRSGGSGKWGDCMVLGTG
jgi:hypothetical protein